MRRQMQLRRRAPLRRTPLRSRATRPVVPTRVRVDVYARCGGVCEFSWVIEPEGVRARCPVQATDLHHRLPRSQGGRHDADNLLALCRDHHGHVHSHPAESYENGWLLRKGTDRG